jgi:hypothetical protein
MNRNSRLPEIVERWRRTKEQGASVLQFVSSWSAEDNQIVERGILGLGGANEDPVPQESLDVTLLVMDFLTEELGEKGHTEEAITDGVDRLATALGILHNLEEGKIEASVEDPFAEGFLFGGDDVVFKVAEK